MNAQSFLQAFGLEAKGLDHEFTNEEREFLKAQRWMFKSTGAFTFVLGTLVWVTDMTPANQEETLDNLVGGRLFGDDNDAISCE